MRASQQFFENLVMISCPRSVCTITRKTRNNKIWRGAPKTMFVSKGIIEMGEKRAKVHGTAVTNKWIDKEKEGDESYSSGRF